MMTTAHRMASADLAPSMRTTLHLVLMAAAVAFALVFALPGSPALGQSATSTPTAPTPSVQGYGDHDKTCAGWTDGCVSCRAGPDHAIACTNTGVACQPKAIVCVQRKDAPTK